MSRNLRYGDWVAGRTRGDVAYNNHVNPHWRDSYHDVAIPSSLPSKRQKCIEILDIPRRPIPTECQKCGEHIPTGLWHICG